MVVAIVLLGLIITNSLSTTPASPTPFDQPKLAGQVQTGGNETRPSILGNGTNNSFSPNALGTSPALLFAKTIINQKPISTLPVTAAVRPSVRSKNLLMRNNEIALLVPGTTTTDVGFFDTVTGVLKRQFPTTLKKTTRGEYNITGSEGRSLRPGEFASSWTEDNHLHFGSDGDFSEQADYDALTGATRTKYDRVSGANMRSLITVADGNPWAFMGYWGHVSTAKHVSIFPTDGQLTAKSLLLPGGDTNLGYFLNLPTILVSGPSLFTIGPQRKTANGLGYPGIQVRSAEMKGMTPTAANQAFKPNVGWFYQDTTTSMNLDTDSFSAIKPFCLTDKFTLVLSQPHDANGYATVTSPIQLTALNKNTGALQFKSPLTITSAGIAVGQGMLNWAPQLACVPGTNEYAAVFLPEPAFGGQAGMTNPDASANPRLTVFDVNNKRVLWTYQYPKGTTNLAKAYGMAADTKMFVAGNHIYIAYLRTASGPQLPTYITQNEYTLVVKMDRFSLLTGAKNSYSYPIPIKGNTSQLNDFAIVNGIAYVLATIRDVRTPLPYTGGAQVLMAIK